MFISNIKQYTINLSKNDKKRLLFLFLTRNVLPELKISESVYNCSFIDLMNCPAKWQIGYSGTVDIELPAKYDSITKFDQNIVYDYDEFISVYLSITGNYKNSENNIIIINENII